jgi:hypothetical protein
MDSLRFGKAGEAKDPVADMARKTLEEGKKRRGRPRVEYSQDPATKEVPLTPREVYEIELAVARAPEMIIRREIKSCLCCDTELFSS